MDTGHPLMLTRLRKRYKKWGRGWHHSAPGWPAERKAAVTAELRRYYPDGIPPPELSAKVVADTAAEAMFAVLGWAFVVVADGSV